jgi:hypothetical protein
VLVAQCKELDDRGDVVGTVDAAADPAGVGQHVVRGRSTGGDQLVADAARERQVGEMLAVEMAELAAAEPELDAAEAVRPLDDAGMCEQLGAHGGGE